MNTKYDIYPSVPIIDEEKLIIISKLDHSKINNWSKISDLNITSKDLINKNKILHNVYDNSLTFPKFFKILKLLKIQKNDILNYNFFKPNLFLNIYKKYNSDDDKLITTLTLYGIYLTKYDIIFSKWNCDDIVSLGIDKIYLLKIGFDDVSSFDLLKTNKKLSELEILRLGFDKNSIKFYFS